MKTDFFRADTIYEVLFRRPFLDRTPDMQAPLQTVYDALSDHFAISIADILVNQSAVPSQTSVTYNLFDGAGSIDLRPDRWRGTFRQITSAKDAELVLQCLRTAGSAIEKISDRMSPLRSVVTVASWFKCDISLDEVTALLSRYWIRENELKAGLLEAEVVRNDLNPTFTNKSEGWEAIFYVAPSRVAGAELFLNYIGTYQRGGRFNSIDQHVEHCRLMVGSMLKILGFESVSRE